MRGRSAVLLVDIERLMDRDCEMTRMNESGLIEGNRILEK